VDMHVLTCQSCGRLDGSLTGSVSTALSIPGNVTNCNGAAQQLSAVPRAPKIGQPLTPTLTRGWQSASLLPDAAIAAPSNISIVHVAVFN